jgi:pimeloyl-ACP methyl ester carboxylesterase
MSRRGVPAGVIDEGSGPAVLCLHGFPQNQTAFDKLAALLVGAGFRVIRYNQRGYTDSTDDWPRRAYTVAELAQDAIQVMDERQIDSWCVVGHDLGGLVAWELGRTVPRRANSLVIVSIPHPAAFLMSLVGVRQAIRSWYFVLAQWTRAATWVYSPSKPPSYRRFTAALARHGLPPYQSSEYLNYLAVGDRFVGAIRWYQAMPFSSPSLTLFRAKVPVRLVWGSADAVTGRLAIELTRLFVQRGKLKIESIAGGSHWLVDQHPADLAKAVEELALS